MALGKILVVFVHGWSVTHTNSYGGLPRRLSVEAASAGLEIQVEEIHLGKYISFHDEVRVEDIARAFDAAVNKQLKPMLKKNRRFVCITHSTGGPVIREWWHRYYMNKKGAETCPMSHLIMLAPANFGSALAQLGKGRLSRIKSWFDGVEPGQAVVDWLELGSDQAWSLNSEWIGSAQGDKNPSDVHPFVLAGQSIDRALYDNLNSYTGELGSDGVVRVAAANLESRYVGLLQQSPTKTGSKEQPFQAPKLMDDNYIESPGCAFRVLAGKSHSGSDMGIMRSVHKGGNDPKSNATIQAIYSAIKVASPEQYANLRNSWAEATTEIQLAERLEKEDNIFKDRYFIHDRYSMVMFRVRDDRGLPVQDVDLILTVGRDGDPNKLPEAFLKDRQRNQRNVETITYYFNYDIMMGCPQVIDDSKSKPKVIREAMPGITTLGLRVVPRPEKGFVHYLHCEIGASSELLNKVLQPNATTLVDIILRRVVHSNVFDIDPLSVAEDKPFNKASPSGKLVP